MQISSVSPRSLIRSLVALGALLGVTWSGASWAVGTRQFVFESGKDFEGGELRGVAIDSDGRLRPGFDLRSQAVSEAPAVWAVLEHEGGLLLATGNEGKLLRVSGGQSKVIADTEALALTSIVKAWGRVFVGSLPGGKIFELKGDKLEVFVTLKDADHVFSLAFDEKQKNLYAATGPNGLLYRISSTGQADVYFDAPQSHLISVAAADGSVYAGSSGDALLYQIQGPGRATVLRDFETTEVRAIAVGKDGAVYAAANELKSGGGRSDALNGQKAPGPQSQSAPKGKGSLYRFTKSGQPEELYSESDDHFVSLAFDESGAVLVGTGGEGRVVRVGEQRETTLWADLDERQVSYVSWSGGKGVVVGSDPIVVHPIEGIGGQDAFYTSKPLDAGLRARFGRAEVEASGKVEVSTRSGNTKEPDASWSDWSAAQAGGSFEVKSPAARYLQVRVRLPRGGDASVRRIEIPFVTDNLRAVVKRVRVDGSKKSSSGLEKSGGPIDDKPQTSIKFSFEVDNPDEDELRFRVEYQPVGTKNWFDALKPGEVLTSEKLTWDTTFLPEGKYRLRVTASDELANPPERVTTHTQESPVFLVDNTPPRFENVTVQGRRVIGKVRDGVGPIRRVEVQQVGTETWLPFEPKDGIFDEAEEDLDFEIGAWVPAGPQLLTIRAYDAAGNSVVHPLRLEK